MKNETLNLYRQALKYFQINFTGLSWSLEMNLWQGTGWSSFYNLIRFSFTCLCPYTWCFMNFPAVLRRYELSLFKTIISISKEIKAAIGYFILSPNTYYSQIGFPWNKSSTNKLGDHLKWWIYFWIQNATMDTNMDLCLPASLLDL